MENFNIKILVVDDSSTMRRIIKNVLIKLGYKNIVESDDGLNAWEKFQKDKFDIVLTDWNMPTPGLDLVHKIRFKNKDIPIIMITTEGGKREVIIALKAGVNNYIVKPFTPIILKEKLKEILI